MEAEGYFLNNTNIIRCGNKAAIMDLPSTDLDKCILLTYEAAVRPEVSNITKRTPDYFL